MHQPPAGADPIHLACVRTPQGVHLIARLVHALAPGAHVALHEADDGGLWARPAGRI